MNHGLGLDNCGGIDFLIRSRTDSSSANKHDKVERDTSIKINVYISGTQSTYCTWSVRVEPSRNSDSNFTKTQIYPKYNFTNE